MPNPESERKAIQRAKEIFREYASDEDKLQAENPSWYRSMIGVIATNELLAMNEMPKSWEDQTMFCERCLTVPCEPALKDTFAQACPWCHSNNIPEPETPSVDSKSGQVKNKAVLVGV